MEGLQARWMASNRVIGASADMGRALAVDEVPLWLVLVSLGLGCIGIMSGLSLVLLPELYSSIGLVSTGSLQGPQNDGSSSSVSDVVSTKAVETVMAESTKELDALADAKRLPTNAHSSISEQSSVSLQPLATQVEEKPPPPSGQAPKEPALVRAQPCPPVFTISFEHQSVAPMVAGLQNEAAYLLDWLSSHPQTKVIVEGHTDALGSEEYNLLLSYRRAKAVATALANAGLPSDRLRVRAFGEQRPLTNRAATSAANRRVAVLTEGHDECPGALLRTSTSHLRDHAEIIAAGLRRTRDLALASNRSTIYVVDPNARQFMPGAGNPSYQLPTSVAVVLYTARSGISQGNRGAIRFYPDGTSTGGRITLTTEKGRWLVDVDWRTGQIHVIDEVPQPSQWNALRTSASPESAD